MATHRAVHVPSAGAEFAFADVETAAPPRDHVRIAVSACGVCGTDHAFVNGGFPGLSWPVTPGHEIAGTVAEVGDGVEDFAVGDRVAVGWFGGNCNRCVPCRQGHFMQCERMQVPSWHYPGGYAESVTAPATALARVPEGLSFVEAAPMGCAGVTTFNGLRKTRAKAGDLVAVLGVGGLGLADEQSAQTDHGSGQHGGGQLRANIAQFGCHVIGGAEGGGDVTGELFGGGQRIGQDFPEQLLLAAEHVVDRPFGHPGLRRDVVHIGPDVTVAQKMLGRGGHDDRPRPLHPRIKRGGPLR